MEDRVECFIATYDGYTYIIPTKLHDTFFYETDVYDRRKVFSEYIISDEAIISSVFVEQSDLEALMDGDL